VGDGNYSISITADGIEISWPELFTSDDVLVAFIHDLRKYGIHTSTKIDKANGDMAIIADKIKARYKRGLYIASPNMTDIAMQFSLKGEAYFQVPEPQQAWIFQDEIHLHQPITAAEYQTTWLNEPAQPTASRNYADLSSELARHIPDIRKRVDLPCSCGKRRNADRPQILYAIQHLNDDHHPERRINGRLRKDRWTRERIADWLDEIDADLTFDPDLPAKRAAARKAVQEGQVLQTLALAQQGVIPTSQALEAIIKPAQQATAGMVKLNVAIEQFESTIHKMVNSPLEGCECIICTTFKQNNQEES
jgi:hypothetical protein